MNKQTGSVLAILVGVALLFAAATDRVGAAISALRGGTPAPATPADSPAVDTATSETDSKAAGGGISAKGITKSLNMNGTHRYTQTGRVG